MIKMIATDLDGTMLKNDWSVSGINAKAVETAQGQGVRWMTVTGRSYRGAMPLMQQYGINCGYVLMNGAEFRDEEGRLIFAEDMDPEKAAKVCRKLDAEGIKFEINTDHGDYATMKEMKYADFLEEGWQQIFEKKYKIRKILCFSKDTEKIKRLKQEIFEETGLSVLSSFADNMEVTAPKAQKGIMLKQVAEYYDIKSEEVVVFGDGWNDLSMIDQFPECLTFFPLCSIDADCVSVCLQLQSVCFKRFFHHGKIFFCGLYADTQLFTDIKKIDFLLTDRTGNDPFHEIDLSLPRTLRDGCLILPHKCLDIFHLHAVAAFGGFDGIMQQLIDLRYIVFHTPLRYVQLHRQCFGCLPFLVFCQYLNQLIVLLFHPLRSCLSLLRRLLYHI